MATYKLIQDVEAEDHILGPLTLRQFIFALIAIFLYWMIYLIWTKATKWLTIPFFPPALFFTFFALPLGRDQPTEIWALAKIRFYLKPRRRIWDQSGMKQLVTVTAPKKIEVIRTDGLSQFEVKSRLGALANTLDSRGWAVKNVNLNAFSPPSPLLAGTSDRLIDIDNVPSSVPSYDVRPSDDILDEQSNPVAQQFDDMIHINEQQHRQNIIDRLNGPQPSSQPQANYWFMNQTAAVPVGQATFSSPQTQQPTLPPQQFSNDASLAARLRTRNARSATASMRTLKPLDDQAADAAQSGAATPDPAILSLANNNDLNVATLAREAKKSKNDDMQEEVVVSLH